MPLIFSFFFFLYFCCFYAFDRGLHITVHNEKVDVFCLFLFLFFFVFNYFFYVNFFFYLVIRLS